MSATVEFKNIFNTSVPTFTLPKDPAKEDDFDLHMVYISGVSKDGKTITVRPVCVDNEESVFKAKLIASNRLIGSLTERPEGITFAGHKNKMPPMSHDSKIRLEHKGKVVFVKKLATSYVVSEDNYKSTHLKNYAAFIQMVKIAQQRVKAKASQ